MGRPHGVGHLRPRAPAPEDAAARRWAQGTGARGGARLPIVPPGLEGEAIPSSRGSTAWGAGGGVLSAPGAPKGSNP